MNNRRRRNALFCVPFFFCLRRARSAGGVARFSDRRGGGCSSGRLNWKKRLKSGLESLNLTSCVHEIASLIPGTTNFAHLVSIKYNLLTSFRH